MKMDKEEIRKMVKKFDAGIYWLKHGLFEFDTFSYCYELNIHRKGFILELTKRGEKELRYEHEKRFYELQELGEKLEFEKYRLIHKLFLEWLKEDD